MGGAIEEAGLRARRPRQADCVPHSWRVAGFYRPASEAGLLTSGAGPTDSHAHSWSDARLHYRAAIAGNEKSDYRSACESADSRDRLRAWNCWKLRLRCGFGT